MFNKILIANRGEIACRIIKSCRELGVQTVAVYSAADAQALHVQQADEAWLLGPAPVKDSYLRTDKILEIAKQSGAQAVHPGYGFLSENADFSEACAAQGLVFIGPSASAIRAMGSKSASKVLMTDAQVPLVPGYHGDAQDDASLLKGLLETGFPALIKASAGGGGKGMRVVENEGEAAAAIAAAKREAINAFGDDKLLIERYLTNPRHIEIQIFCDQQGNGVYLFERDCSIQRRHQKIIEEAPAPGISATLRAQMGETALKAAKAINYEGAGTVEFLYENDEFFFMEMNTRLQVEHPVTEMITGVDLVEWQLRVAAGDALPLQQSELAINGHAMEVRLYAEDPLNDFLPTTGKIGRLLLPTLTDSVRLDTGVQQGDEISPFYDPMLAKLIVHGRDRGECINRLANALNEFHILGLTQNLSFLRQVISLPAFKAGGFSTQFLDQQKDALKSDVTSSSRQAHLKMATLFRLLGRENSEQNPWLNNSSFRLNHNPSEALPLQSMGEEQAITLLGSQSVANQNQYRIAIAGQTSRLSGLLTDDRLTAQLDDQRLQAQVFQYQNCITVHSHLGTDEFVIAERHFDTSQAQDDHGLRAPMNGTLVSVEVAVGDMVEAGQDLIIMEAMKMEHCIKAPHTGRVQEIYFSVGDLVDEGTELLQFEEQPEGDDHATA